MSASGRNAAEYGLVMQVTASSGTKTRSTAAPSSGCRVTMETATADTVRGNLQATARDDVGGVL